jgi:hypothetical protein
MSHDKLAGAENLSNMNSESADGRWRSARGTWSGVSSELRDGVGISLEKNPSSDSDGPDNKDFDRFDIVKDYIRTLLSRMHTVRQKIERGVILVSFSTE